MQLQLAVQSDAAAALQVRYVDGCMRTGGANIANNWTVVPGSWWLTTTNRSKLAQGEAGLQGGIRPGCLQGILASFPST